MFGIPNTPDNHVLAAIVERRLRSDTRMVTAAAALFRLAGLGVLCLLLGSGVGAAFFGYSYITDGRTSLGRLTAAVADALDRVVLKVADVSVKGSVPLDTKDARIGLDITGAVARVTTPDAEQRPTEKQLQGDDPESHPRVNTGFTIFKTVSFGEGEVQTGWRFRDSDDAVPYGQYCMYVTKTVDNAQATFLLAQNREPVAPAKELQINIQAALANCVWFGNTQTGPRKQT